ncbi:MAG: substrate-binding domain-containing protein [Anaerolineaceae bacterium]
MENHSEIIFQRLQVGLNENCSIASQIADQIRWLIVVNEIKPGEILPPVRALADHLNINLHTVRAAYRLLEESKLVSTRQGLGSVVLDYDSSATVATNMLPTNTFGIIVPDLQNPFYPSFLSGAGKVSSAQNVLMITCDTREKITLGKAFFDMLITKRVDGILVSPMGSYPSTSDFFDTGEFYNFPIPLVFVDRPNVKGYSVLLDGKGSGLKGTQHLIEHGHKKIAMLTGNLSIPTLHAVYLGYQEALEKNGLSLDTRIVVDVKEFSYQAGYLATQQLIENHLLPSAIFAAGDMLAIGCMKALREHAIHVPDDVAIVGYNDIDVCGFVTPSLTSITIPMEKMGEESAKLLLALMNKQDISRQPLMMPTELIIRESCGCKQTNQNSTGVKKEV